MTIPWPGGTFPQQGWQCPVCKSVFAPFVPQCFCCGPGKSATTTNPVPVPKRSEVESCPYEVPKTSGTVSVKGDSNCSRFQYLGGKYRTAQSDENIIFNE